MTAHILTGGELTAGRRKPSEIVSGVPADPAESGTNINTTVLTMWRGDACQ